jgi:hypothetical protein
MTNYSNIAVQTTITASISAGDLTLTVASAVGYPAAPFRIVLDPGVVADEEVCQVTGVAGAVFTVTRGYDGTTAKSHASGATVIHAVVAADLSDLQAADSTHAALTTIAHGGIVASTDSRLTDSRTPTAHASTHASAGSDPITIAESQVTSLVADLALKAPLASPTFTGTPAAPTAAADTNTTQIATTAHVQGQKGTANPLAPGTAAAGTSAKWTPIDHVHPVAGSPAQIGVAVSDETTAITTGTAKLTFRMPFAMTLTSVRASLNTASSSGNPAIDVNEGGASIFSTTLTIDANEKTSTTAATAAVISDSALADDAEMTVDIDTAGTGAKGLKLWLIGTRA